MFWFYVPIYFSKFTNTYSYWYVHIKIFSDMVFTTHSVLFRLCVMKCFNKNNVRLTESNYCRSREQDQKNAEDVLFDMFKNEDTGLLPIGKFLAVSKLKNILIFLNTI